MTYAYHAFLSYSRKDEAVAEALQHGAKLWVVGGLERRLVLRPRRALGDDHHLKELFLLHGASPFRPDW